MHGETFSKTSLQLPRDGKNASLLYKEISFRSQFYLVRLLEVLHTAKKNNKLTTSLGWGGNELSRPYSLKLS